MHKNRKNNSKTLDNDSSQEECSIWSRPLKSQKLAVFYSGGIDTFTIEYICEELQRYDGEDGIANIPFTLFLESYGGNAAMVKCFYPMMTSIGMDSIVGISQTSSAAFQVMLECAKHGMPVYIDPMCHVVIHRCLSTINTEERSDRIHDYNEHWIKKFENVVDKMNDSLFKKIDKKFKRNYDAGLNVYLLGSDLIEIGIFREYEKGII